MSEVVSFVDYRPPARFDDVPWETVTIEEAPTVAGTYAPIDSIALSPLDPDPSQPAARSFTTDEGTAVGLWYRVIFVDGAANESLPSSPLQNVSPSDAANVYGDTAELARILKIRNPTTEQETAMRRVLYAAAAEIDSELGRTESFGLPYPALVVEVNYERAVEHWQQEEVPFGILGLGAEQVPISTATDSWNRHAHKLAPLKERWGLA